MRWGSRPKALGRAAASLAALALVGCSTTEPQVVPYDALQDCPEPLVDKTTNGGLVKGITDLRTALRLCNKDKLILREWAEGK